MAIKTQWTADIRDWQKKLDQQNREITKLQEKLARLSGESKRGAKSQAQMGAAATKALKDAQTPAERYKARLEEIDQMAKQAGWTEEQTAKVRKKAYQDHRGQMQGTHGGIRKWIGGLGSVAMGYVSIQRAISAITQEIQVQDEVRRKTQAGFMTLAESQRAALLMLPEKTEAGAAAYQQAVAGIATTTRPAGGEKAVHQVMAETLSAAGGIDYAARATKLGFEVSPYDTEAAKAIAAGSIDFADLLGQQQDLKQNLGWLISVLGQSRVVSIPGLARYGAPAISAAAGEGLSVRESAGVYNAMTKALKDAEGRRAGTATVTAAEILARLLPEKDVYRAKYDAETGEYEKVLERRGTGLKTLEERLQRIGEDENVRLEMQEAVSAAEKKARGGLKAMLGIHPLEEVNRAWRETYEATLASAPKMGDAARAEAERTLALLEKPIAQRLGAAGRVTKSLIEDLEHSPLGQRRARESQYLWGGEEGLNEQLLRSGENWWGRTQAWLDYRFRLDRTRQEAYEAQMQQRIEDLRGVTGTSGTGFTIQFGERTQEDLDRADRLERHLADLRNQFEAEIGVSAGPPGPAPIGVGPLAPPAPPVPAVDEAARETRRVADGIDRLAAAVEQNQQATVDAIDRQTEEMLDAQEPAPEKTDLLLTDPAPSVPY